MLEVLLLWIIYQSLCVPSETEDINPSMFTIITETNESKTLTKHISCECKCKFDETKCNSNQWWNNDKFWCESKKHLISEKDCLESTCNCENGKYIASIMDNSEIMCNEVIES